MFGAYFVSHRTEVGDVKSFALLNPWVLLLLAIVVPIWLLLRRQARLQDAARRLLNSDSDLSPKAYTVRLAKILAALLFIVLGLSRPAHSPTPRAISQGGRDIIFCPRRLEKHVGRRC